MKNKHYWLIITCFVIVYGACSIDSSPQQFLNASKPDPLAITDSQFQQIFDAHNINGAFLLYDFQNDNYITYNETRVDSTFLPASTFKILNSLIALETGVLKNENEVVSWDGIMRKYTRWNQDQTLRSAIKYSTVWFYQALARRIGPDRMSYWVDTVGYGNGDISGKIDQFWLTGALRITPRQQITFLKRLYKNQLPFSRRNMKIVRSIMIRQQKQNYILRAKTGWAVQSTPQIGWYIGYLETNNNVYFFANNIDIHSKKDTDARKSITMSIFKALNLIE